MLRRLTALTSGSAAIDAMLGLGMVAEASSNRDEAVSWYRKVLAADAKNTTAIGSGPVPARCWPARPGPRHRRDLRQLGTGEMDRDSTAPVDPDSTAILEGTAVPENADGRARRRKLIALAALVPVLAAFALISLWYGTTRKPLTDLPGLSQETPHYSFSIYGVANPLGVAVTPIGVTEST